VSNQLSAEQINKLCRVIGYTFQDLDLLTLALTHRSVHNVKNYERLEFLGDSILNFLVAEVIFQRFPEAKEGQLSRVRSELVKGTTLASVAQELDLGDFLILGPGELKSGGHRRSSILADAVEALLGAIYLESGIEACRQRLSSWFGDRLKKIRLNVEKDAKTRLQEYLQSRQLPLPTYEVIAVSGEAHDQLFAISCHVAELSIKTEADGSSRRKAEQLAASRCLALLGLEP